ncbi:MAG: hypothetical protein ACKV19_20280 [Verrucomicrobiales bacterium]
MNPSDGIPPLLPRPKPAVVTFYRLWCAILAIAYLGISGYEFAKFSGKIEPQLGLLSEMAASNEPASRARLIAEERNSSIVGTGLALLLMAIMLLGLFSPRSSWSWGYGFAPIFVSLFPFCVSLAAVIPLLIFWLKPETRQYFYQKS